ncbi:MAG: vWA domain-containing protein [Pseudomonadota bacterium]
MFRTKLSLRQLARAALVGWVFAAAASTAIAQNLVDVEDLQIKDLGDCSALLSRIDGRQSGGQWIVGSQIDVYGLSNGRNPIDTLGRGTFERVECYNQVTGNELDRVFVAAPDRSLCGWVERTDLLDENLSVSGLNRSNQGLRGNRSAICEVPRAMSFDVFCNELARFGTRTEAACEGVPPGLRAKGVLIGSTAQTEDASFPFFSAPTGGEQLETKTFFSVLEIHDLAPGAGGDIMVLVGDGEGDLFGWVSLDAIELWPTRLGLFYDLAGLGSMFQRQRDLVANWRRGTPDADVTSGLTETEREAYIHGTLQLLSYPIIRTIQPQLGTNDPDTPSFHEVIFLGQTGEGSASELMSEAEFANRQDALQRLNVMIVLDTTESMRDYLPLVQNGISSFISTYQARATDPSNRLPNLRLAVYAYSDFSTAGETGLDDSIDTAVLMPPTRIDASRDLTAILDRISGHEGLDDSVGLREEAALEAVAQLSDEFGQGRAWFEDGPRVMIHMADHGSRGSVDIGDVLAKLADNATYYLPVAVVTEDETPSSTTAREAFEEQAIAMLAPLIEGGAKEDDVTRINLINFEQETISTVRDQLDFVLASVSAVVAGERQRVTGTESDTSRLAEDLLASRIALDDALRDQFDLAEDATPTIVQASSAFAPLQTRENSIVSDVDWTYTIALEPDQARFLAENFTTMCALVGSPEQSGLFKQLIVGVAEAFSGDRVTSDSQVRAILQDMSSLPGADRSFLSQPPQILLSKADSTDEGVIQELRRDVCWISYHLGNMEAGIYARPDQLVWSGREFRLAAGEEVIKREYRYKPLIGAETIYLPSFFFVLPSIVEDQAEEDGEETCIFC